MKHDGSLSAHYEATPTHTSNALSESTYAGGCIVPERGEKVERNIDTRFIILSIYCTLITLRCTIYDLAENNPEK